MSNSIPTDSLLSAADVLQIKADVNRGEFKRMEFELVSREPELAIAVSEKYDLVTTILEGAGLSIKQRAVLSKQLSLLVWTPLLLLDRAHRRGWNDFLPSEDVIDESDHDGTTQPNGGGE